VSIKIQGENMNNNKNKTIIHYFKVIFVTTFLLLATCSIFAVAESRNNESQIIKTYSFETPYVNQVTMDNTVYDQIIIPDSLGYGSPGEPNLPAYGVHLLLPHGTDVADIEVVPGEKVFIGSDFNVEPVREPVILSDIHSSSSPVQDELVYTSKEAFPNTLFTEIGTYSFRGYEILVLTIYPVQYIPNSGELFYFKDMTVSVKTVETGQINPLFRNLEKDETEVTKKVDNPLDVKSYMGDTTRPASFGDYDLLILTTDEFEQGFEPLKNAHEVRGVATEIKTLSDISRFPGTVTPDDIRDFIRDEYVDTGIEYVLIGGDEDIVPVQGLWVRAWSGGDTTVMPSDLFYACLDGTYNYDEDELWGEPDDGEDGEDVDLVAEVYVGRACVGSTSEVGYFVDKTLAYLDSGGYSDGQVLMVGEHLWSDPDTWSGDYMDELIDGSNTNMYATVGISSTQYTIDTLYDRDWPGHSLPKSEIKSRINNGARIINHLGHSSYEYNMKMGNDDVPTLTNDNPCFIYSQGCMAGGFDNGDCIAEHYTVKTDNAAFAVIMNARYGWGVVGSTDGASQRYHRQFWDAVFGENIPEIGKANQDSKEDVLHRINAPCMRWCYYQLNLFGDPALTFYNDGNHAPAKPTRPSGLKAGKIGKEYTLKSTTTDRDGDKLHYKWDFGDGTFSEWLGPYESDEEVEASHIWSKIGIYQVKVKARDEHRAESDWSDPLPVKMPIYYNFLLLTFLFELLEKYFPQIYSLLEGKLY